MVEAWKEVTMLESFERRKHNRLNHRCTILLTDERTEHYWYAQLCNISGEGMYFETEVRFKSGTEIDIRFDKPPFRSAPKKYRAMVKWCNPLVDPGSVSSFGVGVKYARYSQGDPNRTRQSKHALSFGSNQIVIDG